MLLSNCPFDEIKRINLDFRSRSSVNLAKILAKNYWKKEGNRYVRLTKEIYGPRQLKEHVYREDTGLGCATRARLITEKGRRLGDNVRIIENDDFAMDIHTEFDLWIADKILRERPEFGQYKIQ